MTKIFTFAKKKSPTVENNQMKPKNLLNFVKPKQTAKPIESFIRFPRRKEKSQLGGKE